MGFEQLAELKKQLTEEVRQQAGAGQRRSKDANRAGAIQKTVDPVVHAIGRLQKRFPGAFPKGPAPKVPLKVGILEDVLAHADQLALSEAEIRGAISTWCRGSRYWACMTDGAARVDLTGAAAGQVTARDSAFARSRTRGAKAPRTSGGSSEASDDAQRHLDDSRHKQCTVPRCVVAEQQDQCNRDEQARDHPIPDVNPNFAQQVAQLKEKSAANSSVGDDASGLSAAGQRAVAGGAGANCGEADSPSCVGPVSFCTPYFGS